MRWRRLEGLNQIDAQAGTEIARLSGLEGFARSLMVGVVPLTALDALGSKEAVSYVFFAGAVITLVFTLNVGRLESMLQRRWVVTLAGVLLIFAALLFTVADGPLIAVAIGMRSAEASIFSVCVSLYIMDYIGKRQLTDTESRRIAYTGAAWLLGPFIGVSLWDHGFRNAPFLISAVATSVMLWYFWRLRVHQNPVLRGPVTAVTSPVENVVRFFGQPKLRIAYGITASRAVFWAVLFIYGPIYVVEAGLAAWVAGSFLSIASAMLLLSPLVRRTSNRFGTRAIIVGSLLMIAVSMVGLATIGDPKPIGLVFWLSAAIGGAALDVLGNIPFMRLVKPRERTAMTTVFSTWREVSFLVAPALAVVSLAIGPFWLLYLAVAALVTASAATASYLPRRL